MAETDSPEFEQENIKTHWKEKLSWVRRTIKDPQERGEFDNGIALYRQLVESGRIKFGRSLSDDYEHAQHSGSDAGINIEVRVSNFVLEDPRKLSANKRTRMEDSVKRNLKYINQRYDEIVKSGFGSRLDPKNQ
ncbi:MAG: hypothetical protein NUV69_00420 [Candidatus Curtissbacteria bacterium]|nr:hypothetical protein [Candidatus Curtissbacteria bacterium]